MTGEVFAGHYASDAARTGCVLLAGLVALAAGWLARRRLRRALMFRERTGAPRARPMIGASYTRPDGTVHRW